MNGKPSHEKISCLLAAFSILLALTAVGCAAHGGHFDHGGRRVTRTDPAQVAGPRTVGVAKPKAGNPPKGR